MSVTAVPRGYSWWLFGSECPVKEFATETEADEYQKEEEMNSE